MIIYFSGTGNTRHCALELAKLLGDNVVELSGKVLTEPDSVTVNLDVNRVVWMFPTYSWGVPPVVLDFMRRATIDGGEQARHYMVTTCGDDIGRCAAMWRRVMSQRGYNAVASYSVTMPNTYVCMKGFDVDSRELERQKLDGAAARVAEIARRISGDVSGDMVTVGSWAWVKTAIIYPWFVRFDMSPRPFRATEACTGCGICRRNCPMDNISADDHRRPVWHDRCAMCLRCYHICPSHAVAYGKTTRGKGQYMYPVKDG